MFFIVLLIVLVVVMLVHGFWGGFERRKRGYSEYTGFAWMWLWPIAVVVVAMLVCQIVWISAQQSARSAYSKIPILIEQRNGLIDLVKKDMSNEDFQALMSLNDPSQVAVLFNTSQGASQVLVTRAVTLVELNRDVLKVRNDALDNELLICNIRHNFFVPRIPFVGPDCNVPYLNKLPSQVEVYNG